MGTTFSRHVGYREQDGYYDDLPATVEYYEKEYLALHPNLHAEDADAKFAALHWALNGPLKAIEISTVLDVGCGSCGVLSKTLSYLEQSQQGPVTGIGVDVSGGMLRSGVKDSRLVRLRADCRDIPLEDHSISLALCFDIVEHVSEDDLLIREVSRLAEYAVFKVPLELSAYTSLRGGRKRLKRLQEKYGHVNHYDHKTLTSLLNAEWKINAENYVKIPGRNLLLDRFQTVLLNSGLSNIFGVLFGGFLIAVARSRRSSGSALSHCAHSD